MKTPDIDCPECQHYEGAPTKTCRDCVAESKPGDPFPRFIPLVNAISASLGVPVDAGANAEQIGGDHYRGVAIQPWDFIVSNALGYLEGNVVKYVSRWRNKNGVQDLMKARHYIDKLIEGASK